MQHATSHTMVFLDAGSMGDTDLSTLTVANTRLQCYPHTEPADVVPRLQQATVAIVNKVVLDATTLRSLPQLKLICIAATGVNNVDLACAADLGITVTNVRGYANTAVPQHAMALLLALSNRIVQYQQAVRDGAWSQSRHFCLLDYPLTELAGKTFVVVGNGALGQATARLAQAFGMRVIVAEQPGATECRPGRLAFSDALAQADVVSLHCPLTSATDKLINRQTLAAIKPGAILINTARGGLIDEPALLEALQNGQLGAAALDVLSEEPPPANHVLLKTALPNLLITPHMAWATAEARQRMVEQLQQNISAFFNGQSLRQV